MDAKTQNIPCIPLSLVLLQPSDIVKENFLSAQLVGRYDGSGEDPGDGSREGLGEGSRDGGENGEKLGSLKQINQD